MELICLAVICVFVILLCVLYFKYWSNEGFASLDQKAGALSSWLRARPSASYGEYIEANPESNIVEYTKIRSLLRKSAREPKISEALRI